ncbi:peroxiredoxin [soil metagenome]
MELNVGDKVPAIKLKDKDDKSFDFRELAGKSAFVVYFYPKNFTPGCTAEACSFRDQYQDFKDLGAEVIAISPDSANSHQKFAEAYNLPFIFLSDNDRKARIAFGVKSSLFGLLPGRETFVFDRQGILRMRYNNLQAVHHTSKALNTLKALGGNKIAG